jgi:hypothetical protein
VTETVDHYPDVVIESGELEPYEAGPPLTLFQTSDPRLALERMSDIARALVDVVDSQRLSVCISGRKHLTAEAWTTLGGMLGIVPVITWTRPNETGDGYVARCEARTLDGRVVGAAEAECSRAEETWEKRAPFTLRSMAQTRSISRALRAPLGQIVVLAGYEAAGLEEMPGAVPVTSSTTTTTAAAAAPSSSEPTPEQQDELHRLLEALTRVAPATDWGALCLKTAGPANMLTAASAAALLAQLRTWLGELEGPQ